MSASMDVSNDNLNISTFDAGESSRELPSSSAKWPVLRWFCEDVEHEPILKIMLRAMSLKPSIRCQFRSWQSSPHPLHTCAFQQRTSISPYGAWSLQQQRRAAIILNASNEWKGRTQGYVGNSHRTELMKWWNSRMVGDV